MAPRRNIIKHHLATLIISLTLEGSGGGLALNMVGS